MAHDDPFALGGLQAPSPPSFGDLWKEHEELVAEVDRQLDAGVDVDRAEIGAMIDRELEIQDQIEGSIATNKAGLVAQLNLMQRHHQDFQWDEFGDNLVGKLIAGIAILGGDSSHVDALHYEGADTALLSAWEEMVTLRATDTDALHEPTQAKVSALGRFISTTQPVTLAGAAVKLRYLADPDIGISAGHGAGDSDVISIKQTLALIERLGTIPGGREIMGAPTIAAHTARVRNIVRINRATRSLYGTERS